MDIIDGIFEKYGIKKVATTIIIISAISLIIIAVLIFKTIADSNEFQRNLHFPCSFLFLDLLKK